VTASNLETVDLLAGLRDGAWLDAQTFPPLRWVLPGLVPEGLALLVGPPKSGKSWFSLDVALAVAGGECALGSVEVEEPRPVLLLALEDGDRRLQERARLLLDGRPIPRLLSRMTRTVPGRVVETITEWLRTVEGEPLVILDTLGKAMPPALPGENAYARDYRLTGALKRITDDRPGMALLALHHTRKAEAADFVDGVSGTNGIAGAADSVLLLARSRVDSAGMLSVTGRDVIEAEYAVTITEGQWRLTGDGLAAAAKAAETARATVNLAEPSAEIVRFVAGHPEGVRAADVAEVIATDAGDAGRRLRRLAEAGRVGRAERGLYVPVPGVSEVSEVEHGEPDTSDRPDTGCEGMPCEICGRPNPDCFRRAWCPECWRVAS
jgi:hypothetical protein